MGKMVNLNADIAEGWGAYDIGNDVELMKIIKSASVACGFHAGDANTMHRLCTAGQGARASASAPIRASTTCGASAAAASR